MAKVEIDLDAPFGAELKKIMKAAGLMEGGPRVLRGVVTLTATDGEGQLTGVLTPDVAEGEG